jgi:hypothetical protein
MGLAEFRPTQNRAMVDAGVLRFDASRARPQSPGNPIVTPQDPASGGRDGFSARWQKAMKCPAKQQLSYFSDRGTGVHICNTRQKNSCDQVSHPKFKLPFHS